MEDGGVFYIPFICQRGYVLPLTNVLRYELDTASDLYSDPSLKVSISTSEPWKSRKLRSPWRIRFEGLQENVAVNMGKFALLTRKVRLRCPLNIPVELKMV